RLPADLERRLPDRAARDDGRPARKRRDAPVELARVARDDLDVRRRDAERVGRDLRERRLVRLPLARETGCHEDLPGDRVDLHVGALVRSEPGSLDVAGEPEPEIAALLPGPLLLGLEPVVVDLAQDDLERLVVIAAVEG